jgi:hypothetical protein
MKGIKLSQAMKVVRIGSTCVCPMPWETPYIVLSDDKGNEFTWISDCINPLLGKLKVGLSLYTIGYVYGDMIKRVKFPLIDMEN